MTNFDQKLQHEPAVPVSRSLEGGVERDTSTATWIAGVVGFGLGVAFTILVLAVIMPLAEAGLLLSADASAFIGGGIGLLLGTLLGWAISRVYFPEREARPTPAPREGHPRSPAPTDTTGDAVY